MSSINALIIFLKLSLIPYLVKTTSAHNLCKHWGFYCFARNPILLPAVFTSSMHKNSFIIALQFEKSVLLEMNDKLLNKYNQVSRRIKNKIFLLKCRMMVAQKRSSYREQSLYCGTKRVGCQHKKFQKLKTFFKININ